MSPVRKSAGLPPSRAQLHEAAVRHLARFAATESGMVRVLNRRIDRWARAAALEGLETTDAVQEARGAAKAVGAALVASGLVDDAVFAAARAARLTRSGRSRRIVSAHLAAKGVANEIVEDVLSGAGDELSVALAFARRRRIGPFRTDPESDKRQQDLGILARAGFSRDVAERALAIDHDVAAAMVTALKRG